MGDIVDYLDLKNELYCWTRATIKHREGNNIELELPFQSNLKVDEDKETPTKNTERCLVNSNVILPLKTLSFDFEWRENLKRGDEVDIYDSGEWFLATVLTTESKGHNLIIGFRLYDETGDFEDTKYFINKKYFQWNIKSEEIKYSRYDSRIRR